MLSASEAAAKRAAMEEVMGSAAAAGDRPAADLTLDDEVDCGSYVRFRASFATEPTCRTPAILCVPRPCLGAFPERRPAALCLMGTDVDVGAMSLVGFSSRPNRAYASELAERGFVTLSPTYPLFPGYLDSPNSAAGATGLAKLGQTAEETEGFAALSELGYASGMRKAIHDNQVAIDCLAALDYVSMAAGVVCVGHSLGGHVCPHALPPHPCASTDAPGLSAERALHCSFRAQSERGRHLLWLHALAMERQRAPRPARRPPRLDKPKV